MFPTSPSVTVSVFSKTHPVGHSVRGKFLPVLSVVRPYIRYEALSGAHLKRWAVIVSAIGSSLASQPLERSRSLRYQHRRHHDRRPPEPRICRPRLKHSAVPEGSRPHLGLLLLGLLRARWAALGVATRTRESDSPSTAIPAPPAGFARRWAGRRAWR